VYLLVKGHFVYPAIDSLPAREAPGRALGFTDDDPVARTPASSRPEPTTTRPISGSWSCGAEARGLDQGIQGRDRPPRPVTMVRDTKPWR
jgi:hypothetical protein